MDKEDLKSPVSRNASGTSGRMGRSPTCVTYPLARKVLLSRQEQHGACVLSLAVALRAITRTRQCVWIEDITLRLLGPPAAEWCVERQISPQRMLLLLSGVSAEWRPRCLQPLLFPSVKVAITE